MLIVAENNAPVNKVKCGFGFPVAKRTDHRIPEKNLVSCKFYNTETEQRACTKFDSVDEDIVDW